jgi:molecular chaperone GrpE
MSNDQHEVQAPEELADHAVVTEDGEVTEVAEPHAAEPHAAEPQVAEPEIAEPEESELEAAQRERDEYLDALRRERAEFENFRKRATKERMDALDRGVEQVVTDLLGVLDNLGFALTAAEASADEQLAKGVQMVAAELLGTLQKAGLDEVPGVGEAFDPNLHEAMLQVEAEAPVARPSGARQSDEPMVVEVLRRGYRFKGRVLRPASVKVAR